MNLLIFLTFVEMLPSVAGSSDAQVTKAAQATGAEWLHGLIKEKESWDRPSGLQISHLFHFQDKAAVLTES